MESSEIPPGKSVQGVSFFCTKVHRWRGQYTRIITIGAEGFATYNSEKGSLTNFWEWKDIENVAAEKPGSSEFYVTVRNGKSSSKVSFRSPMIAEILSEARSHLVSEPTPYLFIGSKVHCKQNKEKAIEFMVKSGYVLMHIVEENRTKLIPIHQITDIAQMSDSGEILLEVCGQRRYYQLRERFGFITALVKEMNLCGIDKDARQRFMSDFEGAPLQPITPSTHLAYPVYRIHNPQSPLSSLEPVPLSNTRDCPRTLYISQTCLEEVIESEGQYQVIHSIEYSAIVGYYQACENDTDFYIQFQSHGFLRLLAFSCDCRSQLFYSLHTLVSPAPLFYAFLPNNTLRFRGTEDHIEFMGNTCIHAIQTHLADSQPETQINTELPAGKVGSTLCYNSLLSACEAFIINSRYFSSHYTLSIEERKEIVSCVKKRVLTYLDLIRKEQSVSLREVCVLFHFLRVFIQPDVGLPANTFDPSFTNLFSASCQLDVPCIQLCHFQLLSFFIDYSSYSFLSSFASSTILLKSIVQTALCSQVSLFSLHSIHLLIQLIKEQSDVLHPSSIFKDLLTFISGSIDAFYTLLLTPSPLQSAYFQLFYHLILFTNDAIREALQMATISADSLLVILQKALFTEQPLQQMQAQAILMLVATKNTTILTFIQRIFPKEFSRVLHTACSTAFLHEFIAIEKDTLSLADSLLYAGLTSLEYPKESLNFPSFFSLFASEIDSYRIVWGPKQREEVKQALEGEIERWKSRNHLDIWNANQFFIPFPSYDQHLQLYGYFLKQLSQVDVSVQCSSLQDQFDANLKEELPLIKLLNPSVLFLSLYSRYLAAETQEHQLVFLRCMRIVYALYPSNCGEFFDCFHLLELYKKEDNTEVQICLLELIQCLCLSDKNKDFFCHHANEFIPLLLERLLANHVSFNKDFCLNAIDVLYSLLLHTAAEHMFPPSDLVMLLTQKSHLLQFVNMLFLPCEQLFFYIIQLLLTLVNLSGTILPSLTETPLIDCLLMGYMWWRVEHVKLLKMLIVKENPLLGLLPSALLYGLDITTESHFISAFQNDSITAKLIWTESMRKHLMEVLALHSNSYKEQLHQDPSSVYQALPLPHIPYKELEDEIYCGKYYLQEFLNSSLSVTIKNPSALLVSIKNEWLREGKRKGYSMTVEQAMRLLEVEEIPSEYDLYQLVWQKLQGCDESQKKALILAEDLLSGYLITATSPVLARLFTLMQVQNELYVLYKSKLKPFLYPSYDIISAQTSLLIHHSNREEATSIVLELCRLIFNSCNCSSENSEEFVRRNGVFVLKSLIEWNHKELQKQNAESFEILYSILMTLVRLSGMLTVHSVLIENQDITLFLVTYLSYEMPVSLKLLIVDYFMNLIIESEFRSSLYHLSVNLLNTAIPLLFLYNHDEDETREKQWTEQCIRLSTSLKHSSRSSSTSDHSLASDLALSAIPGQLPLEILTSSEKAISYNDVQCDTNMLARRVFELLSVTVNNWSTILPVLNALLTKSMVSLLESKDDSFLFILNSESYSSPFIIWSSEMKNQLLGYLDDQLTQSLAGENHFIKDSTQFIFTAIQHELIIADVYVRVFNEQKPQEFVKGNKYLLGILQYLITQKEMTDSVLQEEKYVRELLLSIEILLFHNPDLECYFKSPEDLYILFSFLLPCKQDHEDIWDLASQSITHIINILTMLSRSPRLATMMVEAQFIDILLRLLYQQLPEHYTDLFNIFYNICMNAEGKESLLVNSMVWVYILYSLVINPSSAIAEQALSILQHWLAVESVHSRLVLLLLHFFPKYIIRMMPQESFIQLISTTTINPEIIWDKPMMEKLITAVASKFEKYRTCFLTGCQYECEEVVEYERIKNELVVGDVFIQVYNAGTYKLTNPIPFINEVSRLLIECIENDQDSQSKPKSVEEEKKRNEEVVLYETAILKYCDVENSTLLDEFVDSGLLEKMIRLWDEMREKECLHSPFSPVLCSILMKLSKNTKCLNRIVSSNEVLHTLLACLNVGTSNCNVVACFIYLLFKSKSTELCTFVDELKVISSLLACFKNPIKLYKENSVEDVEKESEILMNIQRALMCIEKIQIMNTAIATQLEENGWNDYKTVNYTISVE